MQDPEICICAAVKSEGGQIIRCHRHSDGIHALVDRKLNLMKSPAGQGFITSRNRFVGRVEGLMLQEAAGILSARGEYVSQLYSKDLY